MSNVGGARDVQVRLSAALSASLHTLRVLHGMPSVLFRGLAVGSSIGFSPSVVLGVLGLPQQCDAVHLSHL